jgi:hypothetical protein
MTAEDRPVSPENRGPWPLATGLAEAEPRRYLDTTADPAVGARQSLAEAGRFLAMVAGPAEPMAHQRRAGPAGAAARADQRAAARG